MDQALRERVSEFYGSQVKKTEDLLYSSCCTTAYDPELLTHLTDEVREKRYGCESPLPEALEGRTLVDLGSGAGSDCFIAARLVGESGKVLGVDMTPELLDVSRRNVDPIMRNLGRERANVEFLEGFIEELPLEDGSVDVVISNCVINLSPWKDEIFREIFRVLKPGGEFFVSDIVADRRIPDDFDPDPRLHSECLTGAAYIGDLHSIVRRAGFAEMRTTLRRPITEVIEGVHFESVIVRAFKLELDDAQEDYGQVAVYRGTLDGRPERFELDVDNGFVAGKPVRVSRNTAEILSKSRYAPHFRVSAPLAHVGAFGALATTAFGAKASTGSSGSGCC